MTTSSLDITTTRRYIVILTALVANLAAGHAIADTDRTDDVPEIVVSLADLEMSKPKGVDLAYGRIRSAAKIVCRVNQSRELAKVARASTCFRSSVDDAVAKVDWPLLSELHARTMSGDAEMIRAASR